MLLLSLRQHTNTHTHSLTRTAFHKHNCNTSRMMFDSVSHSLFHSFVCSFIWAHCVSNCARKRYSMCACERKSISVQNTRAATWHIRLCCCCCCCCSCGTSTLYTNTVGNAAALLVCSAHSLSTNSQLRLYLLHTYAHILLVCSIFWLLRAITFH